MKICSFLCGAAAIVFAGPAVFAQSVSSGSSSLSMPSISAPNMPTVTAPSIGNDYYIPGSKNFYPGIRNGVASQMRQNVATENKSHSQATTSADAVNATASDTANTLATVNKTHSAFTGLTASDLNSMDSMGLLGQFSGLLDGKNLSSLATAHSLSASTGNSSADSILLQQILTELNELKVQIAKQNTLTHSTENVSANSTTTSLPTVTENYTQEGKEGSKILRFIVNGYDVLSTCRDIYFSTQEADGSFLLTGDRKYTSDGENRRETFYFLFHANGAKEGITNYTVTPQVTQDYTNTYSFLYQLSQKSNLVAQRTGNFISMRVNELDWKMDFLLSMQ